MKDKTLVVGIWLMMILGMFAAIGWAKAEGRSDGRVAECRAQYGAQVSVIRERMEAQAVTVDSLLRAIDNRQEYYGQGGR